MIKKTLFFGNPAYLSVKNSQLVVRRTDPEIQQEVVRTVPIEDIGVVMLEDRQITITNVALDALLQNNCAIITCDEKHMPAAGDNITVKVAPYGYHLTGRVTYVHVREDNQIKCGLNFVKAKPLDQYQEILTLRRD